MNKKLERLFQAASAVLLLIAVYFAYIGDFETLFPIAAISALCFFIGIRFQVKERLRIREEEAAAEEQEELDDRPQFANPADGEAVSGLEFENESRELDNRF